ncbi:MAG TPA: transglutaminase family protein [Candidatus Sulfotelmatobacter sp.]
MGFGLDLGRGTGSGTAGGISECSVRDNYYPGNETWLVVAGLTAPVIVTVARKLSHLKPLVFHYHSWHTAQIPHLAVLASALFVAAAFCVYLSTQFVMVKSQVRNVASPRILRARSFPNFVQQDRHSKSMIEFRRNLDEILQTDYPDSITKAVAIRQWVRRQQGADRHMWTPPFRTDHENPWRLLEQQRNGVPGACRRFSYILLGALLSAGFDARIVSFTNSLYRRGVSSHGAVEVWINELSQWVFLDPTFDTLVLIRGRLASALELQEAVTQQRLDEITFERHGSILKPNPSSKAYGRYCRHLFVATTNAVFDGYSVRSIGQRRIHFLHYSEHSAYPVFRKSLAVAIGGYSLGLGAIFWVWTLVSLAAD